MDKERMELERLEKMKSESNAEATDRIIRERKEQKTAEERKASVKSFFEMLVGREMSEAEYILYEERWERARITYNIKTFIKEIGLEIIPEFRTEC
jgi:hypothetical protein